MAGAWFRESHVAGVAAVLASTSGRACGPEMALDGTTLTWPTGPVEIRELDPIASRARSAMAFEAGGARGSRADASSAAFA